MAEHELLAILRQCCVENFLSLTSQAVQENDVAGVKLMGFPVSSGTLGKPFVQSSKMTKITVGDKAYVEVQLTLHCARNERVVGQ